MGFSLVMSLNLFLYGFGFSHHALETLPGAWT